MMESVMESGNSDGSGSTASEDSEEEDEDAWRGRVQKEIEDNCVSKPSVEFTS